MENKQRFIDRIWKRIYRDTDSCECDSCKDAVENGLIIYDEQQAGYLFDTQNDFALCWTMLNYRDNK